MAYNSLKRYAENMSIIADECVRRALEGQDEGNYSIVVDNFKDEFNMNSIDKDLLIQMLSERNEIELTDIYDGEFFMKINPQFCNNENDKELKLLSKTEIDILLARHLLWLNDESGGVQANLSNLYISNYDFKNKDLTNVIIDESEFDNCNFNNASFCFAKVTNSKFKDCDMKNIVAEEANFAASKFINCDFTNSVLTHSNLHSAKFIKSKLSNASCVNTITIDSKFIDTNINTVDFSGCKNCIEDISDSEKYDFDIENKSELESMFL